MAIVVMLSHKTWGGGDVIKRSFSVTLTSLHLKISPSFSSFLLVFSIDIRATLDFCIPSLLSLLDSCVWFVCLFDRLQLWESRCPSMMQTLPTESEWGWVSFKTTCLWRQQDSSLSPWLLSFTCPRKRGNRIIEGSRASHEEHLHLISWKCRLWLADYFVSADSARVPSNPAILFLSSVNPERSLSTL
jgi:hypothetical protein